MAAQLTPNKSSSESKPAKTDSNNANLEAVTMASSHLSFNPVALLLQLPRHGSCPKSDTIAPKPSYNPHQTDGTFQLSVLVVMPSAPHSKPKANEDGAVIPDIVIGVTHIPYHTDNKGPSAECLEAT